MKQPASLHQKSSRLEKWLIGIVVGLAVIVIAVMLFFVIWRSNVDSEIKQRVAQLRKGGFPTTPLEVTNALDSLPAGQNAAVIYTQAFKRLAPPTKIGARFYPSDPPYPLHSLSLSNDTKRLFEIIRATNEAALNLLHQAAAMPLCRFAINLHTVLSNSPGHHRYVRLAAGVLQIEGVLAAEAGRTEDSLRSFQSLAALSRSVESEPLRESLGVRRTVLDGAVRLMQRIVDRTHLSNAQLEDISAELGRAETNKLLPRAHAVERALYLPLFEVPYSEVSRILAVRHGDKPQEDSDGEAKRFEAKTEGIVHFLGLKAADKRLYLRSTTEFLAAAGLPFPSAIDQAEVAHTTLTNSSPFASMLSQTFLQSVPYDLVSEGWTLARLRCARTALAVERYRLSHEGEVPESLASLDSTLLPSIPEDPFDGKPLRYQIRTNGYCIYSVGGNRKDDGGRGWPTNPKERVAVGQNFDITFEVTR